MRRDAFWSGLEAGVSAILSILTSFVVARIVGPAELGIGAAIIAVHVLL
jgi:O-antigen/teichoic acid export membrane protein